ncbi:MAG TPA: response regulator transcription factor [Panacibacter sp.]|nr:response regulator transcription factor [Panacibacter sp.]
MINIALVDDHALLRNGLAGVINSFDNFNVVFEADNGKHFIRLLKTNPKPSVVLLDINMPEMNGFETALWIKNNEPNIKILVLSMMDDDSSIIKMLHYGIKGFILKDSKPAVLRKALEEVTERGFFFNDVVSGKMVHLINKTDAEKQNMPLVLSERELLFLELCCTEKSYKEIADSMGIGTRSVETLRSNMFEKLETLSRVGLVMYSIRNGIVKV